MLLLPKSTLMILTALMSFSSPERSNDDSDGEAASALAAASAANKHHRVKYGKGKSKGKGGRASGRVARVIKRPKSSVASVKHAQAKSKHICFPESEDDDFDAEAREVKRKRKKSKKSKKSSGSCSFFGLGSRGDDSEDADDDEDDSQIRKAFASTSANSFPYG